MTLLVLSCSQHKRDVVGAVPFGELYDGPTWRQVRASGFPLARVAAISGRYGFLAPGQAIATYDQIMTADQAEAFAADPDQVARLVAEAEAAGGAYVVGGALYRRLPEAAALARPDLAHSIKFATGSYLRLRAQLAAWLRQAV